MNKAFTAKVKVNHTKATMDIFSFCSLVSPENVKSDAYIREIFTRAFPASTRMVMRRTR